MKKAKSLSPEARIEQCRSELLKRLRDPVFASDYLVQALAKKDDAAVATALQALTEAGVKTERLLCRHYTLFRLKRDAAGEWRVEKTRFVHP